MKKTNRILAIFAIIAMGFIFSSATPNISSYCDGWEDGYCEGWKDVKGQFAICPIPPICPIPEINCDGGNQNNYRCGYNRGFKQGMRDASKQRY
ncbi:MAG: hypothetical protein FWC39_13510 [Bacteroidetes bacterium]|nr:hypothetical protein [Bacteroidota bacterium]